MKRPIAIALFAAALGATAFWGYKHPAPPLTSEVLYDQPPQPQEIVIKVPVMTELGAPTANRYSPSKINSRNPWDMAVFDGKLYVGSGDYGDNTGPCDVWQYDPATQEWTVSGTVDDEAVANFELIDGRLIITGTDPMAGWENGSFYALTADGWTIDRTVPFGVHMFDIAQFQGKTFYGIGNADNTQSPVQMTVDGENYTNTPFYIGEESLLNNPDYGYTRCYNLFEGQNELYAFCFFSRTDGKHNYGFFRFDGDAFRLVSPFSELKLKSLGPNRQVPFNKAVTFNGRFYFSTGYLYRTSDFTQAEKVDFPENTYVQDITVQNGRMYILTSKEVEHEAVDENGEPLVTTSYINTVWEYDQVDGLTEIYSFEYGLSAMSLEKDGDIYYIGIGLSSEDNAVSPESPLLLNGTVIKVEFVEKVIIQ